VLLTTVLKITQLTSNLLGLSVLRNINTVFTMHGLLQNTKAWKDIYTHVQQSCSKLSVLDPTSNKTNHCRWIYL